VVQAKLTVSAPGDPHEREADRVAAQLVGDAGPDTGPPAVTPLTRSATAARAPRSGSDPGDAGAASPAQSPAAPEGGLSPAARSYFEPRLGRDLGGVRLHTGMAAARAARALEARAYTLGRNIVFGAGEYAPGTSEGRRLLAHELVHVAQQTAPPALPGAGRSPVTSTSSRGIQRQPLGHSGGTARLHEELIEQWRAAHGLPPHGIDPVTQQQVGPTDSEIRFGGLLEQWLAAPSATPANPPPATSAPPPAVPAVRTVAAPAQAPAITAPGSTVVTGICGMGPAAARCLTHQTYVRNILPQAVANIRAVASPYSTAIADMYTAALPATLTAPAPVPQGASSRASGGPVTVTFAGVTHTFTSFNIDLQQWAGGANGQAFGIGGPVAFINLNELSQDALGRNIAGIEQTMVHETLHILMEIVEARNRARAPGTPLAAANLDRASYAAERTRLVTALLPFINQIRALPSFAGQTHSLTAQAEAGVTADTFLSETIARVEAGIYARQRSGQAFGPADVRALPQFIFTDAYWTPTPPTAQELTAFLALPANHAAIDAAIQPIINDAGDRYLNLRP
jgi:hypothetical protein